MDQSQASSRPALELERILSVSRALQRYELLVTATIAIGFLLAVLFYRSKQEGRRRLPPGPRPWPIIGNLGLLSPLPHHDFLKLAKKYGPIFHLRLGSRDAIVISSPKMAKEILKANDIAFASRPWSSQFDILGYSGRNLIAAPYGAYFRQVKSMFTSGLLNNKRVRQFQNSRKEGILRTISSMFDECKEGKPTLLTVNLHHMFMNNITQMMMSKSVFGPSSSATDASEANELAESIEQLIRLSGEFVLGDYIPLLKPFDVQGLKKRMRATAKQNDKFFQRILDDHRQEHRSKQHTEVMDMVDVFLTHSTGNEEIPLTDVDIKGSLLIGVLAGMETSSSTVLWAMVELLKHPDIMKRAQDELDAVVGRDRLVVEADIPNLKYLGLIVKETFRLHPVTPLLIPHECVESREIAGYHIPVKSQVFVSAYAIQRDPEVWERPLKFDPERFLSTNIDVHGQDFELLPFGSGRRLCPGKNLGIVMVAYILAVLLHACDWSFPPGVSPDDVDLAEELRLSCGPKNPLEAIVSPRLSMDVIFGNGESL